MLALLLAGANLAAQRYAKDTAAATAVPEYASLGGLRAWRLSHEPSRRDGLLDQFEQADTQFLMQWSTARGQLGGRPALWRLGFGLMVQEANSRSGAPMGVMVATGLSWPDDACWVMSHRRDIAPQQGPLTRLGLSAHSSCNDIGWQSVTGNRVVSVAQQEIKSLWSGESVIVLSPSLAQRTLGDAWHESSNSVWVGAGSMVVAESAASVSQAPTTPATLQILHARGWTVHEIRHEPSALSRQAQRARRIWLWAMAALGLAVGALAAWGYRQVLALTVAIRRTGGAGWPSHGRDALTLSASLAALMIASSAAGLALCVALGWVTSAHEVANWMLWPWAGLALGLLLASSMVSIAARITSLQRVFARGAQG